MLDEDFLRNEVEPYIDKLYLRMPLISRNRDLAVIHLLRVFEDASRSLKMRSFSPQNQELQYHTRLRWAHEAIPWALRWVWSDCPARGTSNLELDWTLYNEARELMNLSFDYYHVCRFFVLYSRGLMAGDTNKDRKRVRFYFRSNLERDRDVASIVYDVLQDFQPLSPALFKNSRESVILIDTLLPVYIRKTGEFSISCETPPYLMECFKSWVVALVAEMKFGLPGTWQFEDYTLDQFRTFWKSLLAYSLAHIQAHDYADETVGTKRGAVGSLVIQASEQSLVNMGSIFPIPPKALHSILNTLVYRPAGAYWDPFWQPLIRISNGTVLIAPHLVTTSSPERNLVTLLTKSPTGRACYDKVSTEKEQLQLNALSQLFTPPRYRSRTRVTVPRGDSTTLTDIDLLLHDNDNDVLLLLHAKWFIRPDTIQEQLAREQESLGALKVASAAVLRVADLGERWISRALGIELDHLPTLRSVIVCRDFIPSGFVDDQGIPIVSELFFTKVVKSSQFTGLASLYESCAGFTAAVDKLHSAKVDQREIQIGEYVFELPNMVFAPPESTVASSNPRHKTP